VRSASSGYDCREVIGQPITIVIPRKTGKTKTHDSTASGEERYRTNFETVRKQAHGSLIVFPTALPFKLCAKAKLLGIEDSRGIYQQKTNTKPNRHLLGKRKHRSKNLLATMPSVQATSISPVATRRYKTTPSKDVIPGDCQCSSLLYEKTRWIGAGGFGHRDHRSCSYAETDRTKRECK